MTHDENWLSFILICRCWPVLRSKLKFLSYFQRPKEDFFQDP